MERIGGLFLYNVAEVFLLFFAYTWWGSVLTGFSLVEEWAQVVFKRQKWVSQ